MENVTQKQVDFAKSKGFSFRSSPDGRELVFEMVLDMDLRPGESYSRDGWASKPGQGRLLPRLVVFRNTSGNWRFTHYRSGTGRSRQSSAKMAWKRALKTLASMKEAGFRSVPEAL